MAYAYKAMQHDLTSYLFFLVMFIWVVVYSLFNAAPIVGLMFGPRFCYTALIVLSCFAIILLSKKELVALF